MSNAKLMVKSAKKIAHFIALQVSDSMQAFPLIQFGGTLKVASSFHCLFTFIRQHHSKNRNSVRSLSILKFTYYFITCSYIFSNKTFRLAMLKKVAHESFQRCSVKGFTFVKTNFQKSTLDN